MNHSNWFLVYDGITLNSKGRSIPISDTCTDFLAQPKNSFLSITIQSENWKTWTTRIVYSTLVPDYHYEKLLTDLISFSDTFLQGEVLISDNEAIMKFCCNAFTVILLEKVYISDFWKTDNMKGNVNLMFRTKRMIASLMRFFYFLLDLFYTYQQIKNAEDRRNSFPNKEMYQFCLNMKTFFELVSQSIRLVFKLAGERGIQQFKEENFILRKISKLCELFSEQDDFTASLIDLNQQFPVPKWQYYCDELLQFNEEFSNSLRFQSLSATQDIEIINQQYYEEDPQGSFHITNRQQSDMPESDNAIQMRINGGNANKETEDNKAKQGSFNQKGLYVHDNKSNREGFISSRFDQEDTFDSEEQTWVAHAHNDDDNTLKYLDKKKEEDQEEFWKITKLLDKAGNHYFGDINEESSLFDSNKQKPNLTQERDKFSMNQGFNADGDYDLILEKLDDNLIQSFMNHSTHIEMKENVIGNNQQQKFIRSLSSVDQIDNSNSPVKGRNQRLRTLIEQNYIMNKL